MQKRLLNSPTPIPAPAECDAKEATDGVAAADAEDSLLNNSPVEVVAGELLFGQHDPATGKDEMNLAGNPFALVRYGTNLNAVIDYEWERRLPNGKMVKASWRVAGDAQLGLPGPAEECVYLLLLELTREAGWTQTVFFSRYKLLERLGWGDNARHYGQLNEALIRLKAVDITAVNAFWDARTKSPLGRAGFSILDNYEIIPEPEGLKVAGSQPLSFFKWNDVIFNSLQAGNLRDLALEFALSLRNPTARRLFRYLDMHRNAGGTNVVGGRRSYKVGLTKLRDHLGLIDLRYASKVKERLEPAHAELIERGFLAGVEYQPMKTQKGDMVIYAFGLTESIESKTVPSLLGAGQRPSEGKKGTSRPAERVRSGTPCWMPTPSTAKGAHPSRLEVALSIEMADAEARAIACDEVFEALPDEEKARLDSLSRATLPPFLQEQIHSAVAVRVLREAIRERVRLDHEDAFQAQMRANVAQ